MHTAVSRALIVEKERVTKGKATKQQILVHFILEVLNGSKKFYSELEKICYAIVMSACNLRHYFEAQTIKVLTSQPLNNIFGNRDNFDRISNWAMELSEHVVDIKKQSAIKSQILADFVAEWTELGFAADGEVPQSAWLIYCDRAWGTTGARAVAILASPS
jgi:predicted regulator of amino acid metabolism with ACT domain